MGLVRYDQNDVIILRKDILVFQQFFHSSSFLTRMLLLEGLSQAQVMFSLLPETRAPPVTTAPGVKAGAPSTVVS